jgi:hypothetical protein
LQAWKRGLLGRKSCDGEQQETKPTQTASGSRLTGECLGRRMRLLEKGLASGGAAMDNKQP